MSDDIINQVFAEAQAEAEQKAEPKKDKAENQEDQSEQDDQTDQAADSEDEATEGEDEPTEADDDESDNDEDGNEDDDTPWPQKAVYAKKRRDKRIRKMRERYEALEQQYNELEQRIQAQSGPERTQDNGPLEDDFDTYGDFLKAQAVWEYQQNQNRGSNQGQQAQQGQEAYTPEQYQQAMQLQQQQQQVVQNLNQKLEQHKAVLTDFEQLEQENQDILDAIPAQTMQSLLMVDDLPLAFYTLAKEDMLDSILDMTPAQALVAAAQAQVRGNKYLQPQQPKQQRLAPKPLKAAKGTKSAGKDFMNMGEDQLLKELGLD